MSRIGATSSSETVRAGGVAGLTFATPQQPLVSIVIPVHNHFATTAACLRALHRNTDLSLVEVIVVDDASADETARELSAVEGLTLVRLEPNRGFLGATSAGIDAARGKYLHLLNNDTEVQPGWLTPLLEVAETDPRVGAVGSKLIFPNGLLQEAGSIIWADATGRNLGSGDDAANPAYNVRGERDYCSAASLLVRRDAYRRVGGLDHRFAPAYYEDTDLCFSLRAAGFPVVYEPRSVVVHHGSLSHTAGPTGAITAHALQMETNRYLFAAKWASELLRHWPPSPRGGLLRGRMERRPRVLICDHVVPAHDRDSGGLRMTHIVRLLVELGCEVSLASLDGRRREPYTSEFQALGVHVHDLPWTFEQLAAERAGLIDLVVLSRPAVGKAFYSPARVAFPGATFVYDTVDLHQVRAERRHALHGVEAEAAVLAERRTELDLLGSCEVATAVSSEEAAEILRRVPRADVVVLPNVHEVPPAVPPPLDGRAGMVFIGGFDHPPNVDAMLWFVESVVPLVHRAWPAHLTILGSNPPPEIAALQSERVTVTGYIADVEPYFDSAAVFVAPLRYGAGVKGKVGQALALGLPVVTTTVGAEGMGIVDGVHALVRDDAAGFAAAVVQLASDPARWSRMSTAGRSLIAEGFTPERMRSRLQALLNHTVPQREFVGRLERDPRSVRA